MNDAENSLAVILDERCAGLAEPISKFARTFVFTRSQGFLMSPNAASDEMHTALTCSGLRAPYLLVGASYAAFTQLLFAFKWPELVAGLILIDPSHRLQGETALRRLAADDVISCEAVDRFRAMLRGFGPAWDEGCRDVSVVSGLGNIPVLVLEAGALEMPSELSPAVRGDLLRERHTLLCGYAALSSRGAVKVIAGTGHNIISEKPEVVLSSIEEMIAVLKTKSLQPVPPQPSQPPRQGTHP